MADGQHVDLLLLEREMLIFVQTFFCVVDAVVDEDAHLHVVFLKVLCPRA